MSVKNKDLTEYIFSKYTSLEERDGDRLYYTVNTELGEGFQILYRIIDGMYVIYSNQCYYNNVRSDPDSYQDIIMMYQLLNGEVRINLKNHKTAVVRKDDIVNFAGVAEFNDSYSDGSWIESVGLYCYYEKLCDSLKEMNIDISDLKHYYFEMQNRNDVLLYSGDVQFMALSKELKDIILADNRFLMKAKALELLYRGITNYRKFKAEAKQKYDRTYIDCIFEIKKIIDENPQQRCTIAEMATKCGISQTYFKKIFKECFACQPHKYIMNKRLEKSKELLQNREKKIAEVALELNFASSSKFSGAFQREYGFLPSDYRNLFQKE
jgi:AraC-like DNA-binding protein